QAGILNGDDGLSSKILQQRNLLVAEGTHLLAVDVDISDQFVVLHHWHEEKGSRPSKLDNADCRRIALLISNLLSVIRNVDKALRRQRAPKGVVLVRIDQWVAAPGISESRRGVMHCGDTERIIFA